jgi:hypothetical protein
MSPSLSNPYTSTFDRIIELEKRRTELLAHLKYGDHKAIAEIASITDDLRIAWEARRMEIAEIKNPGGRERLAQEIIDRIRLNEARKAGQTGRK